MKLQTALIDISESTTVQDDVIEVGNHKLFSFQFGTITSTAMTFQASYDGTTFVALNDDAGTAISITVASDKVVAVTDSAKSMALAAVQLLKCVMGSVEAADRTIEVVLK